MEKAKKVCSKMSKRNGKTLPDDIWQTAGKEQKVTEIQPYIFRHRHSSSTHSYFSDIGGNSETFLPARIIQKTIHAGCHPQGHVHLVYNFIGLLWPVSECW